MTDRNTRLDALRRMALCGQELHQQGVARRSSWEPVLRMLKPTRQLWLAREKVLQNRLLQVGHGLEVLGEPLLQDLGLHRWLRRGREEAYSDWLAWLLEQLPDVGHCLRLFGDVPSKVTNGLPFRVERELPIQVRYANQTVNRRLDVVVRCADAVLIVVEVKTTDAESADTKKQVDYARWLEQEQADYKSAVLLASSGKKVTYDGDFKLWTWESLIAELRKEVPVICEKAGFPAGAMAMAFVGAVEKNLLDLPTSVLARARCGMPEEVFQRLVRYLDKAMEE